ncbi:MAG: hypothetical protein ACLFQK_03620 [Fibrobacterota bacterium]
MRKKYFKIIMAFLLFSTVSCVRESTVPVEPDSSKKANAVAITLAEKTGEGKLRFEVKKSGEWNQVDSYDLHVYLVPENSSFSFYDTLSDAFSLFKGVETETYGDSIGLPVNFESADYYIIAAASVNIGGEKLIGNSDSKKIQIGESSRLGITPIIGNGDTAISRDVYITFPVDFSLSEYDSLYFLYGSSYMESGTVISAIASGGGSGAAINQAGTQTTTEMHFDSVRALGQAVKPASRIYLKLPAGGRRKYVYAAAKASDGSVRTFFKTVLPMPLNPVIQVEPDFVEVLNLQYFDAEFEYATKYNRLLSDSVGFTLSLGSEIKRKNISDTAYVWMLFSSNGAFVNRRYDLISDKNFVRINTQAKTIVYETPAKKVRLSDGADTRISFSLGDFFSAAGITGTQPPKGGEFVFDSLNSVFKDSLYAPADLSDGSTSLASIFGEFEIDGEETSMSYNAYYTSQFWAPFGNKQYFNVDFDYNDLKTPLMIDSAGNYDGNNVYRLAGIREVAFVVMVNNKYFDYSIFIPSREGFGEGMGYDCVAPGVSLNKEMTTYNTYNLPTSPFDVQTSIGSENPNLLSLVEDPYQKPSATAVIRDSLFLGFTVADMGGSVIRDIEIWIAPLDQNKNGSVWEYDFAHSFINTFDSQYPYGTPRLEGMVKILGKEKIKEHTGLDLDLCTAKRLDFNRKDLAFSDSLFTGNRIEELDPGRDNRILITGLSRYKNGIYALWFITEDEKGNRHLAPGVSPTSTALTDASVNPFYFYLYNDN